MGLDSECDLAYAAEGDDARQTVRTLRDALLAEHLGVTPDLFAQTYDRAGSLIVAVEALNRGTRRLVPYIIEDRATEVSLTPGSSILDPSQPLGSMLSKLTNSQ